MKLIRIPIGKLVKLTIDLNLKNLMVFGLCILTLQTKALGGLQSFTLEEQTPAECQNSEQAFERFTSNWDYSPTTLENAFSRLSPTCQSLLRDDETFNREIRLILEAINIRFNNSERLQAGDLELLKYTTSLINESPTPEQISTFNNFMSNMRKTCTSIDQREKMPPIRDQDSIGWCYAYTAADLVSFKSNQNVSAIDIAINYNNFTNQESTISGIRNATASLFSADNLSQGFQNAGRNLRQASSNVMLNSEREGGFSGAAIEASKRKGGFCLERDLPSDSYETSKLGQTMEIISEFENVLGRSVADNPREAQMAANILCDMAGNSLAEIFGALKVQDIADILVQSYRNDLASSLRDLSCKNRVNVSGEMKIISSKDRMRRIDEVLTGGGIVGFDYYIEALGLNQNASQTNGLHASTIVGRRWNEELNTCQYLVRNSWGESCTYYEEPDRCEKGNVWIDRDQIQRNTIASYIYE